MGSKAPQTTTTNNSNSNNSNRGRTVISINELLNWEFQYFNSIQLHTTSVSLLTVVCVYLKPQQECTTNQPIILQWSLEKSEGLIPKCENMETELRAFITSSPFCTTHAQSSAELTTMETCWTKEQVPIWTEKHHDVSPAGGRWETVEGFGSVG